MIIFWFGVESLVFEILLFDPVLDLSPNRVLLEVGRLKYLYLSFGVNIKLGLKGLGTFRNANVIIASSTFEHSSYN